MKTIKDFENYAITKDGRVWSYGKNKFIKTKKHKQGHGSEYIMVKLCKNSKAYSKTVHRLVAEAFIPNPENKPTVDHIDRDSFNNKIDNLRWFTYSEQQHNRKRRTGARAARKVICVETGIVFQTISSAAKSINRSQGNLSDALSGKIKTTGGYHWKYLDD